MSSSNHSLVLLCEGFIADPALIKYVKLDMRRSLGSEKKQWGIYVALDYYSFLINFDSNAHAEAAFAQVAIVLGLAGEEARA